MTTPVPAARAGFTLVELAVTLFILTLLLGSVLIPLQTQVESRKIEETQDILDRAREALLGYASAFGYFPCPATATSAGLEPPPPAPPVAGTDHTTGECLTYDGFLPAALLGFTPVDSEGFGIDAWGSGAANRIRYAVSNHTVGGIATPFTASGGMSIAGVAAVGAHIDLIHICGSGVGVVPGTSCGGVPLASNVVAVVWSPGQNALTGGTGVHEAENANPQGGSPDRIFVSRVRAGSGPDEFDDQLSWISGFLVVSRLVASGQLP